ncbi:Hypothetical protein SRAE_X000246400 [Strongyloides ratti]|uniref:Uncharacterized protein n=1 Tax=Strongyloides ratti TaxID=34506 RepID=A0A090KY53_STRRB|nr:Hypothetical protein SRAE_X000246400 [Strongyloides ratti]CEF60787.1 Hypothetical protein SRAE_X000246400 [Strongyloides ratti]
MNVLMLSLKLNILIISVLLFGTAVSQDYQNVDDDSIILDNYMTQKDISVDSKNKEALKDVLLKDDTIEFFSRLKRQTRQTLINRLKTEQLRNQQAFRRKQQVLQQRRKLQSKVQKKLRKRERKLRRDLEKINREKRERERKERERRANEIRKAIIKRVVDVKESKESTKKDGITTTEKQKEVPKEALKEVTLSPEEEKAAYIAKVKAEEEERAKANVAKEEDAQVKNPTEKPKDEGLPGASV